MANWHHLDRPSSPSGQLGVDAEMLIMRFRGGMGNFGPEERGLCSMDRFGNASCVGSVNLVPVWLLQHVPLVKASNSRAKSK